MSKAEPANGFLPDFRPKNKFMNDFYWFIGLIGIWLLLQLVILPKLGVST